MQTLYFRVTGRRVELDPSSDLSTLIPGSKEETLATFSFSNEWRNTTKVVAFYSRLGHEYPPQLLKDGQTCIIPSEALEKRFFSLKVIGRNGLTTNKLTIDQKGG